MRAMVVLVGLVRFVEIRKNCGVDLTAGEISGHVAFKKTSNTFTKIMVHFIHFEQKHVPKIITVITLFLFATSQAELNIS